MKSIIEQSLKNENQLQRIIYQFSDAILLKITKLLARDLDQYIADYYRIIKVTLNQLEDNIKVSETQLRLEIWRGIFLSLSLKSHQTQANKLILIQESLLNIATRLSIEYSQLIGRIMTTAGRLKAEGIQFKTNLTELLVMLSNDQIYIDNEISEIASKRGSQIELLSYFIQTGMLPWWSEKLSKQQLEEYCDRLIETSPDQIKRLVENSIKDERQLRRIIFQFSEPTLLKIAELMADNLSAFLSDYLIVINKTLKGADLTATRIPENRLKWELWRGILLSLYEKGNHPPDPSQLIAENLLYLATRLPCEYPRLLREVIETIASLQTEGQSFRSSLPEELVKLSDRHPTQLQSQNHSETSSQQLSPDVIGL